MPETDISKLSTEQKYARIFGLPEEDISSASYDMINQTFSIVYGVNKPRYKQTRMAREVSKEFADFFRAPIFAGKSLDYILTAYLKARGMNPVVREGQRSAKVYYTSTDPKFGKMTMNQFIETEVDERGNYTLAVVNYWLY